MKSILVFLISLIFIALGLEAGLRIKNLDEKNYDIEMWKFSQAVKKVSDNSILGHENKENVSGQFQNTVIDINSWGIRGPEPELNENSFKILFLGSSITMGWGVPYENTYPFLIEKKLNENSSVSFEVLNASVVNYNTEREVELFLSKLLAFNPDLIILSYFVNDAEILESPTNNWLLKHSQLAVLIWSRIKQLIASSKSKTMKEHYEKIYQDDYPGFLKVKEAFQRLKAYKDEKGIFVLVTMIPDIHVLDDYPLDFVHEKIKRLSEENGFDFLDFKEVLLEAGDQESLWAMPGDPHPNALGHSLMSEELYYKLEGLAI